MEIINNEKITADILPFDFNKLNMNPCLDMDRQEEQCSTGKTANEKVTKRQYKASNRQFFNIVECYFKLVAELKIIDFLF